MNMVAPEVLQEEKLIGLAHQIDLLQLEFAREAAAYAGDWEDEVDGFTTALNWIRHNCHPKHPARVAAEEAELIEQRSLKFSQWPNGAMSLNGVLDPVGGAAVLTALQPLSRPLGGHDERTQDRRLADALVELASGGDVKANLQVTTSIETLAGMAGAPCADIERALPISSESVKQLTCD